MIYERAGVPTVTICTDAFDGVARAAAGGFGLPELPVLLIEHPLADRSQTEIEDIADALTPKVLGLLTSGQSGGAAPNGGPG